MTRSFSERSLRNMLGLHPHLLAVLCTSLDECPHDFVVIDGLRTHEEQALLVAKGKSWTMNSAHLTGMATDTMPLVNGGKSWPENRYFVENGQAMDAIAERSEIDLRWGGDWDEDGDYLDERNFDGPHHELSKREYDWKAPHPITTREEWPPRMRELLRFDDPDLCPIKQFADDAPAAPARNRSRPHRRRRAA